MDSVNLRFGPYELKARFRELYKHGVKLKLRPQSFQVLQVLLERSGDLVTREDFRQRLWPSDTFVDFEHGLNSSVKNLRRVLNDSATEPRYIETLPKLGYRFIFPVEVLPESATVSGELASRALRDTLAAAASPVFAPKEVASDAPNARTAAIHWRALLYTGIALVAILAAGVAGYVRWSHARLRPPPSSGRIMLAVLPFENLTGDPTQDYFSDGLTEEMIARMGRVDPQRLGVIAHTSVMQYKSSPPDIERIARELGVQYVLAGSVRRDAGQVLVTAELIRAKDQSRVWGQQYDRELSHLHSLQGEIAQSIASEIRAGLGSPRNLESGNPETLSPDQYEAYDLYLRGTYFLNQRTLEGLKRAIEYFQESTDKDPTSARAFAALANSYGLIASYGYERPNSVIAQNRAAAQRAVELDDNLAAAHTSLALIAQNYDWKWEVAETEYRRAIELDPNYATAHHWYAEYLSLVGRFDEALVQIEIARQLDPLSLIIAADKGAILFFDRKYDLAIRQLRGVLDMDPEFPRAHLLGAVYVENGMYAQALDFLNASQPKDDQGLSWTLSFSANAHGRAGEMSQARRDMQKLEDLNRRYPVDVSALIPAYIGVGDKDKAFAAFDRAYREHAAAITTLKVNPTYDPLRSDPRFHALLHRVGLDQP